MLRIKLVRDRCNAVLEGQCKPVRSESEYIMSLVLKMHEEVQEIAKNPTDPSEYADLMETMKALADAYVVSSKDILDAKSWKHQAFGGFEEGQIWTEVML